MGVVNLRFCGFIAVVKVKTNKDQTSSTTPPQQTYDITDQADGGAHSLNINRSSCSPILILPECCLNLFHCTNILFVSSLDLISLRMLLHDGSLHNFNNGQKIDSVREFVEGVMKESLKNLEAEEAQRDRIFLRWELGACWVQHLQDEINSNKEKKNNKDKNNKKQVMEKTRNELRVEGLGKPLRSLKNPKKTDIIVSETAESQHEKVNATENEQVLKKLLSEEAFTKLKESETGLHNKVIPRSMDEDFIFFE